MDGFIIGNLDTKSKYLRCPLVLSLLTDGIVFGDHYIIADEHYERKKEGLAKDGEYGYPHTMVHDGHLCIISSRKKEAIEAIRIRLEDIK